MDQLVSEAPFARFIAETLGERGFTLIDAGSAYGLARGWRAFGAGLRGFGFDPNPVEVERLNKTETAPGFRYATVVSSGLPLHTPLQKSAMLSRGCDATRGTG